MTLIANIQAASGLVASPTAISRHAQLQALQRAGRISGLLKQPSFSLTQGLANGLVPTAWRYYIADFAYQDHATGHYVLEGRGRTRTWIQGIQVWLVFWMYGIAVRQV